MSTSGTDSEPELEPVTDTVSSLTTFAHLSAARPSHDTTDQQTVNWAVDTLSTLDFRLVRTDTALHDLIWSCASTILALLNTVLQQEPAATDRSCGLMSDVASILRPSFLHLLFQYRRLFHAIATRDLKSSSAPLAIVCWVDVTLAKLGDVIAFIATSFDKDYPDRSLPEPLKVQTEENNLRAAIQLPDNCDMLPSMLLSERVSVAAKRLSIRLILGRYILYPALSGQVDVDNALHKLYPTFADFVRQSAARLDGLCPVLEPGLRYLILQERLTSAMTISLFAAADTAQDSTTSLDRATAFRPQTVAAAMQLLRFVLDARDYPSQTNVLSPSDHLDIPTRVVIQWEVVPQWTWSLWLEYRGLYAGTITWLTTAYIQHHHSASSGTLLEVSDLMSTDNKSGSQAAAISIVIDLVFRSISMLSTSTHSQQLSTGVTSVLHGSCRLISQWMNRDLCGIRNSKECCKALIILFGYLSRSEQCFALNELVIECLVLMKGQCTREAWKTAVEDAKFCFLEALNQCFIQTKMTLSQDGSAPNGVYATQVMQFLVVMMSKKVQPLDPDALVEFIEVVGERVLEISLNDRGLLCETFLICFATANLSEIDFPFNKINMAANNDVIWYLGMCSEEVNLFLVFAFSLYITSAPVSVEPLTYLEGLEHLVDIILLICSRHYPCEDETLALVVLPTVCDALTHLLEYRDSTTEAYIRANTRLSTLDSVLRSFEGTKCDGYGTTVKRALSSTARGLQEEMDGEREGDGKRRKEKRKLMLCRLQGYSHLLYISGT